jgi:methionyl-tRNA formyltransferase
MKIIFFGSPSFAVPGLEILHSAGHEIMAVVTQPDRPVGRKLEVRPPAVKVSAQKLGLPVLQPVTTKTPEFVQQIASFQPEIFVVIAYGEILRPDLLDVPPLGAVNLHASLLPKYRGAAPIPWAILNGEKETGATTMLINEIMDSGPILMQSRCPILPEDTTASLTRTIAALGAPLLQQTLEGLETKQIPPREQDPAGVTFAPKLKKEDGLIDWTKSAQWISAQVRAFDPWPGSFSSWNGSMVKFWSVQPETAEASAQPGTILRVDRNSFSISCGGGTALDAREVQPENRPRMAAGDFINGYRVVSGMRFGN